MNKSCGDGDIVLTPTGKEEKPVQRTGNFCLHKTPVGIFLSHLTNYDCKKCGMLLTKEAVKYHTQKECFMIEMKNRALEDEIKNYKPKGTAK